MDRLIDAIDADDQFELPATSSLNSLKKEQEEKDAKAEKEKDGKKSPERTLRFSNELTVPEKPKVRKKVKKKAKKPKAKTSDININQDSDVGERETTK